MRGFKGGHRAKLRELVRLMRIRADDERDPSAAGRIVRLRLAAAHETALGDFQLDEHGCPRKTVDDQVIDVSFEKLAPSGAHHKALADPMAG